MSEEVDIGPPIKSAQFLKHGLALAGLGAERVGYSDALVRAASDGRSKTAKLDSAAETGYTGCQIHTGGALVPIVDPATGKPALTGVALCCYHSTYSPEAIAARKAEGSAAHESEQAKIREILAAEEAQRAALRAEVDASDAKADRDRPDPGPVDPGDETEAERDALHARALRLAGPRMEAGAGGHGPVPLPETGAGDEFGAWLQRLGVD